VGSGTGLGLSVVHQFVVGSGGSIGVESEQGRGTSFYLHFPAVVERRKVIPRPDGAEIGILVVDDDPLVRRTIVAGLKRVGYLVFDAGGGQSALNIISESADDIQLVITDQMMPGMSGNELRKRIASLCPELPVILMSGYTSGLDDKDDKTSGFARILMKPITIEQLNKIIDEVLNTSAVV
jgi:CheY-like chemotaxis protein